MRLLPSKHATFIALAVFATVCVLSATGVISWRDNREQPDVPGELPFSVSDPERARQLAVVRKSSKLAKALIDGHIRFGDSLADVLARHPGGQVEVHGGITTAWYVEYHDSLLIAKEGRLMRAEINTESSMSSSPDYHVLFDSMTLDDWAEVKSGELAEHHGKLDRVAALCAVVGTTVTSTWLAEQFKW